ncbi:MAG: O-antigen polymerase, partial [Steroidobacteraceae bacterium]|nr:O-antigen polymerase [Steroidobacteraceae bacterium]
DTRWQAWILALRLFAAAPVSGTGIGEFAGAAFETGLPGAMAAQYQVWTSPHNLFFHLLAETGALGAGLVLIAWGLWWWQSWRQASARWSPAAWWVLASVGVEFINSMLEYPLWSAHFLLLTALLMGVGGVVSSSSPARTRQCRFIGVAIGVILVAILAVTARDYWRLDVTRVTGTPRTLAGTASSDDAETLISLGSGPLGPVADLWRCLGVSLDREDLAAKLGLSGRVMRYWPSQAIVTRRAILLAFAGRGSEAVRLVSGTATAIGPAALTLLRQARETDPQAIDPLLAAIGVQ